MQSYEKEEKKHYGGKALRGVERWTEGGNKGGGRGSAAANTGGLWDVGPHLYFVSKWASLPTLLKALHCLL